MLVTMQTACDMLLQHDNIVILAHQKPDGDTLGSSFALLYALEALGKTARVECADGYPARYAFLYGEYVPKTFKAQFVVAVDIAGTQLLGEKAQEYADRIDLCIDHHKSNELYAHHTFLDVEAPAVAQMMYHVVRGLGVTPDTRMTSALFTGLSTDTGCFRFTSVTAETHRVAADLIEYGAQHGMINKLMFDTRSRGRLLVEKLMLENLHFYFEDRCALIMLPADLTETFSVEEEELDGIASFPIRIEGVLCGLTLRERADGTVRVSARTVEPVDASRICAQFGGGGHMAAAGCTLDCADGPVRERLLDAVRKELERTCQ